MASFHCDELRKTTHCYNGPWVPKDIKLMRRIAYGPGVQLVQRVIDIYTDKIEVTQYFQPKYELKKIGVKLRVEED